MVVLQKNKYYLFKNLFLGIILLIAIFIVYLIYKYLIENVNKTSNNIIKCNMKFGLCPAAKCIPNPYDDSKAYCECDVANGINYSVGNNSCENIKPYTSKSGEEVIFSDFSPVIKKMGYHLQMCSPEAVNMNCMNKICSVDPNNPSKAICLCDKIDNNGLEWVTFNKNGLPKTCNYQSGASKQSYLNLNSFIRDNYSAN
jgi:hypothetical protein